MAPYCLPLLAALAYTVSALFIKKALNAGGGSMRVAFLTNWILVPCFLPLLLLGSTVENWAYCDTVLLCALFNTLAMVLIFVTLKVGDVSLQTPVMGAKVIMVAVLSVLMGVGQISLAIWLGSCLTVLAIYILSKPNKLHLGHKRSILITIALSLLTSLAFAIADLIMAKYAPSFGEMPFLVWVIVLTALFSCVLIPYFEGPLRSLPKASYLWIGLGGMSMALECIFYCYALARYNDPALVNILYSSRGLWSVALVWLFGKQLGMNEGDQGKEVLIQRLLGAVLLFIAILIVILKHL